MYLGLSRPGLERGIYFLQKMKMPWFAFCKNRAGLVGGYRVQERGKTEKTGPAGSVRPSAIGPVFRLGSQHELI